jgi:hypothetical protein
MSVTQRWAQMVTLPLSPMCLWCAINLISLPFTTASLHGILGWVARPGVLISPDLGLWPRTGSSRTTNPTKQQCDQESAFLSLPLTILHTLASAIVVEANYQCSRHLLKGKLWRKRKSLSLLSGMLVSLMSLARMTFHTAFNPLN